MLKLDSQKQREFAVEVVRQLRDRGFQAYWAGGCVRDHLLRRTPKDYDVATSAHPEEIRGVFHHRKTLAIGAAFGVMTILGPRGAGQIEVATFRHDVSYSDGRHPDRVEFSSPEDDARRRDFTINGMFYDPLTQQVIDYVGGEADVRSGLIRAIGNARDRFTEDKLRMLRAVRFAATLGFRLEESTFADICEMAPQMNVVSAERIAEEMRMILVQPARVRAVGLLLATGLLAAILPEAATVAGSENWSGDLQTETDFVTKHLSSPSALTLRLLNAVENPSFPLALAILLHSVHSQDLGRTIGGQWKLARTETDRLAWLLENQNSLAQAQSKRWSQLQPLLIAEGADDLLKLHAAKAAVGLINPHDVVYCRTQLGRPAAELNPAPFVTGADLLSLHIPAGPIFARLLRAAREAQLDDVVVDRAAALELIKRLWGEVQ